MNNTLIALFGGSGFLGRYVVKALADAGYRIRVGSRQPHRANFLLPLGQVGQIQLVKCNAADPAQINSVLTGADGVVNLVGVLRQGGRQSFQKLHRDAPAAMARQALEMGAQTFVHVSAMGVSTSAPSEYARSKAEGEIKVREAFPAVTILRPSLLFGPEDDFFNRFAAMARFAPALPLIGGGRTQFQPVYVADVAEAVARSIADPGQARGRTFELGGPLIYTFKELMQVMLRETCRKRALVPVPFGLASLGAGATGWLPYAPLTLDQVRLLKTDNVMTKGALGLNDLGIDAEVLEAILPTYLWRFRPEGQFQPARA